MRGEKWSGIDIHSEEGNFRCFFIFKNLFLVRDNLEACIWEPALVKKNSILAATEAACLVLSVDQTIKNPKRKNEMPVNPGMPGM